MWPLVAPSSPALAAPATPNFGGAIDGYAANDSQDTCDPTEKPGAIALRTILLQNYPGTSNSGITRNCSIGGTSEHKEGRAFDWGTTSGPADNFLAWVLATDRHGNQHAMARRLGIMYMIWNRRIWSAAQHSAGWRTYACDGTPTDCHEDHVHFSLSWDGAYKRTSWWSGQQQFLATAAGNLYHTLRATGGWTQWGSVEGVAGSIGTPAYIAAAEVRGETHVLATSGGALYHAVRRTNGTWTTFANVDNAVPGGAGNIIDVEAAEVNGELHVIVATQSGGLLHTIRHSSSWTAWGDVEGVAGEIGSPKELAATGIGGTLHVLVVNQNRNIFHSVRSSSSWTPLTNVEPVAGEVGDVDDVAAANVSGLLHVVVTNTAGDTLHTIRYSNSWSGFASVEGVLGSIGLATDIGAVGEENGDFHLIATNDAGNVFHTLRRANGTWTPFGNVESVAGAIPNPTIEVTGG